MRSEKRVGLILTKKQTAELLSAGPYSRDEALSQVIGEVVTVSDGRLAVLSGNGRSTVYPSREVFATLLAEWQASAAKGPYDPPPDIIPSVPEFLANAPNLAQALATSLRRGTLCASTAARAS